MPTIERLQVKAPPDAPAPITKTSAISSFLPIVSPAKMFAKAIMNPWEF
jgi:hypothetical protein